MHQNHVRFIALSWDVNMLLIIAKAVALWVLWGWCGEAPIFLARLRPAHSRRSRWFAVLVSSWTHLAVRNPSVWLWNDWVKQDWIYERDCWHSPLWSINPPQAQWLHWISQGCARRTSRLPEEVELLSTALNKLKKLLRKVAGGHLFRKPLQAWCGQSERGRKLYLRISTAIWGKVWRKR